jgi:hypothetical protein
MRQQRFIYPEIEDHLKPILAIKKGEDIILPEKYHKINNLCAIIYDQLTEIYKRPNYKDLSETIINFTADMKFTKEFKKGTLHPLDWLKRNELNEEIEIIITKQIILAIGHDFINFVFESMDCAKHGKMSVAYALLRKPFTDELLIFEQLLVNRHEFINRFYFKGYPEDYDPSDKKIDKKKMIALATKKLRVNLFPSSEFIYDLRYNKSYAAGINGISNHALHLVTRDRNYRTLNQNFNFVFWNQEDMEYFFKHYYGFVPYLLIYAVSIIDELVFNLLTDVGNQRLKTVKEFRRLLGLILFTEYKGATKKQKSSNNKLFKEMSKKLIFKCSACGHDNKIVKSDFECFFETEEFYCKKCLKNLLTTKESIGIIEKLVREI